MDLLDYVYEKLLTEFGDYYEDMDYIDNIKNIRYRNKAGITIYRIKTTPKPFTIGGRNYIIKSEISVDVKAPNKRLMKNIENKLYDIFDQQSVYNIPSNPINIQYITSAVSNVSYNIDKITVSQMQNVDGDLVFEYTPEITGNFIYNVDIGEDLKTEFYLQIYNADDELYETTDIKNIYTVPSLLKVGDWITYYDEYDEYIGRIFKIEDNYIYVNNSLYTQLYPQVIANNDITKENHLITQQSYIIKADILLIR